MHGGFVVCKAYTLPKSLEINEYMHRQSELALSSFWPSNWESTYITTYEANAYSAFGVAVHTYSAAKTFVNFPSSCPALTQGPSKQPI